MDLHRRHERGDACDSSDPRTPPAARDQECIHPLLPLLRPLCAPCRHALPRHCRGDPHPRRGRGGIRLCPLSRVERGKSLSRGGGGVGDGVSRGAAFLCIMFGIRICHFLGSVI